MYWDNFCNSKNVDTPSKKKVLWNDVHLIIIIDNNNIIVYEIQIL